MVKWTSMRSAMKRSSTCVCVCRICRRTRSDVRERLTQMDDAT
jgi:hypothetical protein